MSRLPSEFHVSTGGHNNSRRLVPAASSLFSRAFMSDPVIRYMLSSMPAGKRAAYLPIYFSTLLTAATMNRASIESIADRIGNAAEHDGEGGNAVHDEFGEWKCCGVLMPPGETVDNPWTLLPAGLLGMARRVRWGGCVVRVFMTFPFCSSFSIL